MSLPIFFRRHKRGEAEGFPKLDKNASIFLAFSPIFSFVSVAGQFKCYWLKFYGINKNVYWSSVEAHKFRPKRDNDSTWDANERWMKLNVLRVYYPLSSIAGEFNLILYHLNSSHFGDKILTTNCNFMAANRPFCGWF